MSKGLKIIPFLIILMMNLILETHFEQGEFIIIQGGNEIGTEKFEIRQVGEDIIASGETVISMPQLQFKQKSSLRMNKKLQPIELYVDAEVNGQSQKTAFIFTEKVIKIENEVGGQKVYQEVPNQENGVIIANNVFHHINVLVKKYDYKKGGEQEFISVPSVSVKIIDKGYNIFQLKGQILRLRRLFMTLGDQFAQNVWVDEQKRIIKMSIPLQAVDVVLKGYEDVLFKR